MAIVERNVVEALYRDQHKKLMHLISGPKGQYVPRMYIPDLAHDAWEKVIRLNSQPKTNPEAYMVQTVVHVVHEWRSHSAQRKPHESMEDQHDDLDVFLDERSGETSIYEAQLNSIMHAAMNRLTPRQKQVMTLRYWHDLQTPEIAKQLDVTQRIVQRDLTVAFTKLREHVAPLLRKDMRQ